MEVLHFPVCKMFCFHLQSIKLYNHCNWFPQCNKFNAILHFSQNLQLVTKLLINISHHSILIHFITLLTFALITEESCLALQRLMWQDAYNLEEHTKELGQDNKCLSYTVCCSFIFWMHGSLGQGNQRVIPLRSATLLRHKFPSPDGIYTGYVPHRFV